MNEMRVKGAIKWFNPKKGYGFVVGPNEEDIFIHYSHITMEGYKTLNKGQEVEYDLIQTDRGPQAHNVAPAVY